MTPARVYAATRIALGLWIVVDPAGFGRKWLAPPQDPLRTGALLRAGGGRDVGIGVGLLTAREPRPWLLLCAGCDVLDAGLILHARRRFAARDVRAGAGGALAYGLVALALAAFATRTGDG